MVLAGAFVMSFGLTFVGATVQKPPAHFGQLEQEREVLSGEDHEFGDAFLISLGGKIYDNLWAMSEKPPPAERNPDYPADPTVSNADTWRCVTCHGWDYAGAEIMNSRDGQPARMPGLRDLVAVGPTTLRERFGSAHPAHVGDLVVGLSMELLLLFLSAGQRELESLLPSKSVTIERLGRGQDVFEGVCMSCHNPLGTGGFEQNLDLRQSLGWLARHKPERTLHRIINGVPGREMLALRFLEDDAIRDLMSYLQTLDPDG